MEETILFGIYQLSALLELLEKDKLALAAHLEGEILEEYQRLVDLEIQKLQELKKTMVLMENIR